MRTTQKTPDTTHLTAFMERNNLKAIELSEALGVGGSSVSHWLKQGHAPRWTLIAIEGLMRRQRDGADLDMLLVRPKDKATCGMLTVFLEATKITYTIVPTPK